MAHAKEKARAVLIGAGDLSLGSSVNKTDRNGWLGAMVIMLRQRGCRSQRREGKSMV